MQASKQITNLILMVLTPGVFNIKLSADQMHKLKAKSDIELGFPHDFLRQDGVKEVVFSGHYDKLINLRKNILDIN